MYDRASGKILKMDFIENSMSGVQIFYMVSICNEPAFFSPNPMAENWVDKAADERRYDQIGYSLHAFGNSPRNDRASDGTKNELEDPEWHFV